MTLTLERLEELTTHAGAVIGPDGVEIGGIGHIYLDADTSSPEWLTVRTGRYGSKESFVPLRGATSTGNDISVCFDKWMVADAPRVDAGGSLSADDEGELYAHYGLTEDYEAGFDDDDQAGSLPEGERASADPDSAARAASGKVARLRLRCYSGPLESGLPVLDHGANVTMPAPGAGSDGSGTAVESRLPAAGPPMPDQQRRVAHVRGVRQQQMPARADGIRAATVSPARRNGGSGLLHRLRSERSVLAVLGRTHVSAAALPGRAALPHRSHSTPGITLLGGLMTTEQPQGRPPASETLRNPPVTPKHDPAPTSTASDPQTTSPVPSRRTSGSGAAWLALIIGAVVLVFMLIFILQNNAPAQFTLLAWSFSTPMGVAMLFAALAGALVAVMVGTVRMVVLRRNVRQLERERAARS